MQFLPVFAKEPDPTGTGRASNLREKEIVGTKFYSSRRTQDSDSAKRPDSEDSDSLLYPRTRRPGGKSKYTGKRGKSKYRCRSSSSEAASGSVDNRIPIARNKKRVPSSSSVSSVEHSTPKNKNKYYAPPYQSAVSRPQRLEGRVKERG